MSAVADAASGVRRRARAAGGAAKHKLDEWGRALQPGRLSRMIIFTGVAVLIAIGLVAVAGIFAFFVVGGQRVSDTGAFISDERIANMATVLQDGAEEDYFPLPSGREPLKVVWFFVDGFRLATVDEEEPLRRVLRGERFQKDGVLRGARSELPTLSYPNYVAQWTGAPPELSGVFGNSKAKSEGATGKTSDVTELNTIFQQMARYNRTQHFVSGRPESDASDFFYRHTEAAPVHPEGYDYTLNEARLNATAVSEELVTNGADLSIYFHGELDSVAHRGRVSRPEFKEAARVLAEVLEATLDRLDNQTVLVISADHGLLDEGSHSGVEEHLRNIPFCMYRLDSGINESSIPEDFGLAGLDTFTIGRTSRNIDVAPSVAAMLRIPTPHQSVAYTIPLSLAYAGYHETTDADRDADEYAFYRTQYQQLLLMGQVFSVRIEADPDALLPGFDLTEGNMTEVGAAADHLRAVSSEQREDEYSSITSRAITWAMLLTGFLTLALFALVSFSTLRDTGHNAAALVLSFLYVLTYTGTVAGMYQLYFEWTAPVDRQYVMNSSQLDTSRQSISVMYVAFIGVPVLIFCRFLRGLVLRNRAVTPWLLGFRVSSRAAVVGLSLTVRTYSMVWTLFVTMIFAGVGLAVNSFAFYDIPFVNPTQWKTGFVSFQVLLMLVPLLICSIWENISVMVTAHRARTMHRLGRGSTFVNMVAPGHK